MVTELNADTWHCIRDFFLIGDIQRLPSINLHKDEKEGEGGGMVGGEKS